MIWARSSGGTSRRSGVDNGNRPSQCNTFTRRRSHRDRASRPHPRGPPRQGPHMASGAEKRDRVILAYSGGLDTSVMVRWIGEKYNLDVVTFTVDLGQGE